MGDLDRTYENLKSSRRAAFEERFTAEKWEASGKLFFEAVKIGDFIDDFLVQDITQTVINPGVRYKASVNILAYHYIEESLEPLRAVFQLNKDLGQFELKGYRTEGGKILTIDKDLISPKEAIEQGLLDDGQIEQLKSFGSSDRFPILTLEGWKNINEALKKVNNEFSSLAGIFYWNIGFHWHVSTDFVKYWTGQSSPKGEAVGKEAVACVALEEKDEFVAAKPVFKELSVGEWELVGYIANGNLYDDEEIVRSLDNIDVKPSEVFRNKQPVGEEKAEEKPSSEGLQALNLW